MSNQSIAAVGDNCIDVYAEQKRYYPGGNPVNVAVYSQRYHYRASYVGVVGEDDFGTLMVRALREKGVDISHLKVAPGATATTQITLENGNRIFGDYDEGVMANFALHPEDIEFICGHDILVTSIYSRMEAYIPQIHERGLPILFDFSDKIDAKAVSQMAPYVDYAFFSMDEPYGPRVQNQLEKVHGLGAGVVIITLGAHGSVCYDGQQVYHQGIIKGPVVDTLGAGDSYIAGFIVGVLSKEALPEAMKKGAENSCITIGYSGAW